MRGKTSILSDSNLKKALLRMLMLAQGSLTIVPGSSGDRTGPETEMAFGVLNICGILDVACHVSNGNSA